jgi:hypothetical protein
LMVAPDPFFGVTASGVFSLLAASRSALVIV